MLNEDFKYELLLLSVAFAIVAVIVMRYLAKRSRVFKLFMGWEIKIHK